FARASRRLSRISRIVAMHGLRHRFENFVKRPLDSRLRIMHDLPVKPFEEQRSGDSQAVHGEVMHCITEENHPRNLERFKFPVPLSVPDYEPRGSGGVRQWLRRERRLTRE